MTAPILSAYASRSADDRSAHLVGIGGAGMKALAELLVGLGWRVTGSDSRCSAVLERMRATGLRVYGGHAEAFVPAACDVLVHSPAVGPDNPERAEAARRGMPQCSLPQMLGDLTDGRVGVAVAGTHGKSTTTAMVAAVLRRAGRDPSVACGAELCGSGRSGWAGAGDLFVTEACEYQRSFLQLRPTHGLMLGVEPDHFDCYTTFDALKTAFAQFAALLPAGGVLAVRNDCPAAAEAAAGTRARLVTFGMDESGDRTDYRAADARPTRGGTRFRVFCRGDYLTEVTLRVPGTHNVLNALAAATLCHELGVPAADLREGLYDFRGVRRRFEAVGSWRGRPLIDDYAHHPTAVRAAIATARTEHPGRRVWAAFQPHQLSRTVALLPEFAAALAAADGVFVLPVYAARESSPACGPADGGVRSPSEIAAELAAAVAAKSTPARFVPSLDLLVDAMDDATRPGDVLVTLGAGDIDQVHHEFSRRLRRHHAAG